MEKFLEYAKKYGPYVISIVGSVITTYMGEKANADMKADLKKEILEEMTKAATND